MAIQVASVLVVGDGGERLRIARRLLNAGKKSRQQVKQPGGEAGFRIPIDSYNQIVQVWAHRAAPSQEQGDTAPNHEYA